MSVQDGQGVNATITNAAFLSRLNDSSTIGKQDFNNTLDSTAPTNGSIHTQGGLGVEKNLNVGVNAAVGGTLAVTGVTTAGVVNASQVNSSGDIAATGQITAATLDVSGNANAGSISVDTDVTVGNDLTATGDITANNLTATLQVNAATIQTTGDVTVGDDIIVTDNTQTATLNTTGLATLNSLSVTTTATVGGKLTVVGDLEVQGTTTTVNSATLDVTDTNITVNNLGTDISAEGAGLTVDRAGTSGSLIYKDASASKFAAGPLGSEVDLADISSAQTFTNKSISGSTNTLTNIPLATAVTGTLPITNGGTGQTTQTAAFDALAPSTTKGDVIVHNGTDNIRIPVGTDGQVLTADSVEPSGVKWATATGGGGGGTTNLITDGNAESGITNYIAGSYPNQRIPTGTFTASSGAGLFEISTTTTAPLSGLTSFLLTKTAGASRRGRAIERTINIDPEYRGKVLQLDIKYTIVSGTFVAGDKTTDSSLIWYIAESNGGAFTFNEPSNFKMYSNSTTLNDVVTGAFQTKYDTTQLKLIAYVSEAVSSAWVVKCEVGIKPNALVFGTPMTDWQSYTPTFQGFGTPTNINFFWRRVGDSIDISGRFTPGTTTAVEARVGLPNGLTIDSVKGLPGFRIYGTAAYEGASGQTWSVIGAPNTYLNFSTESGGGAGNGLNPVNGSTIASAGIEFSFHVSSLPIAGFASVTRASDGFDARLVDVKVGGAVASTAINTTINFPTTFINDGANYSAGVVTILVSGRYDIDLFLAAGAGVAFDVFVNGSSVETLMYTNNSTRGYGQTRRDLKAGDLVTVRPSSGASGTISLSRFQVKRVTGPQSITLSEKVKTIVNSTSGQSLANSTFTVVLFNNKDLDTHNAYNTSTGEWLQPRAGTGKIYGSVTLSGITASACTLIGYVTKNGSIYSQFVMTAAGVANSYSVPYNCPISGVAGDVWSIVVFQNNGGTRSLDGSDYNNRLTFELD